MKTILTWLRCGGANAFTGRSKLRYYTSGFGKDAGGFRRRFC